MKTALMVYTRIFINLHLYRSRLIGVSVKSTYCQIEEEGSRLHQLSQL